MAIEAGAIAAPRTIDVPVKGGAHRLTVSPWTMEQHDACFPIVAALLEKWSQAQAGGSGFALGELITLYESEIKRICQITVAAELARQNLTWQQDLWAEDLYGIADAIWQTSLVRPGGGGILGKAIGLLGPVLAQHLVKARSQQSASPSPETDGPPPMQETSSQAASPSSPEGGAAPLS